MAKKPDVAFTDEDLVNNPAKRCPSMFVLDTSTSMDGDPINELNAGVQTFIRDIRSDPIAQDAVELGVITFDSEVKKVLDFGPIQNAQVPVLRADGSTRMGEAVRLAIKLLSERREKHRNAGLSSYIPWLVLMTDGGPNDNWQGAAVELKSLGEKRKIVVFAVGIGNACDFDTLAKFCPHDRPPFRLQGYDFKSFFAFMSKSLEQVVASGNTEGGFGVPAAAGDRSKAR